MLSPKSVSISLHPTPLGSTYNTEGKPTRMSAIFSEAVQTALLMQTSHHRICIPRLLLPTLLLLNISFPRSFQSLFIFISRVDELVARP